jgi:hypothetical protein
MPIKQWKEVDNSKARLMVIECLYCGYHTGIDLSYLEAIGDTEKTGETDWIETPCPVCGTAHTIEGVE